LSKAVFSECGGGFVGGDLAIVEEKRRGFLVIARRRKSDGQ
jgi:hypothetical protein